MAPSAAVEIDPRLLRQLEEEYETLKNDSSGARGLVPPTRASARLLVPISDDPTLTSRWTTTFAPTPTPPAAARSGRPFRLTVQPTKETRPWATKSIQMRSSSLPLWFAWCVSSM